MKKYLLLVPIILLHLVTACKREKITTKAEPEDPLSYDLSVWNTVDDGLNISFASTNIAYNKSLPPGKGLKENLRIRAWKGEEVHAKLLIWSKAETGRISIQTIKDPAVPAPGLSEAEHRIVRYVLADSFLNGCGSRDKDTIPSVISPDILSEENSFIPGEMECRPVWISLETASNCAPGIYRYNTELISPLDSLSISFEVEVLDRVLPPPRDWSFHLDLWQNPFAVARYNDVQLWSQEHWDLMLPLLEKLASAGQKCITTTVTDRP